MKRTKRILAIVLATIMLFGTVPAAAFATEAGDAGGTEEAVSEEVTVTDEEQEAEPTVEDVSEETVQEDAEEAVEETPAPEEEPAEEEAVEPAAAEEPAQEMETASEETAEDAAAAETVTEEPAQEMVDGPVTLTANGSDYTVTASFDASSGFPADVQMKVSEIKKSAGQYDDLYDQTLEAVQNDTDAEVELTYARFFDITFYHEGEEVEPAGPVSVNIKYNKAIDVESSDAVSVYHFDARNEAPQSVDIETSGRGDSVSEISFETDGFSIYAVVGTSEIEEDESRMTLNFYNLKNSNEPIATIYIKNDDDTDKELEQIIYDPGAGTMASGQLFKGWIEKENYTVDDVDNRMSIADIRAWAKQRTSTDSITEDEEHNFYAMVYNTFSVVYKDEDGITLRSDALISDGNSVDYTIYQMYTPADQDEVFLGWYADPRENVTPKDALAEYPYENNTAVTITGNVVLSVYAPKGHWLNFEGNGKGARYTPPQFIVTDEEGNPGVTVEPEPPTRNGYTFDGWYTGEPAEEGGAPTGDEFPFGNPLDDNTTLYAKWNKVPSANYSVIIWKQRASDDKDATDANKTYDVAEVIQLSGTPGASASSVVDQNGSSVATGRGGRVKNYRIDGSEKAYTGFHAGRYDTDVTIDPEGTTVLNVYYDRNLITISFDTNSYSRYIYDSLGKKYVRSVTYTGLYNSELSFDWPTQYWGNRYGTGSPTPLLWYYGDTGLTFLGAFKLSPETEVSRTFTLGSTGNIPIRFIRQKPDGSWPEIDESDYVLTVNTSRGSLGNSFTVSNKYAGFTAYQYKTGDYTTSDDGWNGAVPEETVVENFYALNIRFKRDSYKISFLDGTYFNGEGAILQEASKTPLHESDEIFYQASTASYNKGGGDYYEPAKKDGYVFAGWYVDPTCTREYTFDKMPEDGITVYAKWVQKQYRVFLHPNVPADDASFSMGNQSTSFLIDFDEKIANGYPIQAERDGYDLIGWYSDEDCKNAFNFAAYRVNDTTVNTPYDTSPDGIYNPTDPTERNQYGNVEPGKENVNKDAQNNRIWVLSKLELYAKWRATLDGAKGIGVIYNAGEGSNPPTDSLQYLDNSEANAGAASTPPDDSENPKQFKYWVVQKWDDTKAAYVDTEKIVYPGDVFTVLKANAKAVVTEWVNPADDTDVREIENPDPGTTPPDTTHTKIKTASYTVSLRAEYGDAEAPTPTHITWYANNGTGNTETSTDLQINEAVDITKPGGTISYNGHKFLGWARMKEVSDADGNVTSIGGVAPAGLALDLDESDLFLQWDAENGRFLATDATGSGYTAGQVVTQIAADEKKDYHGMVAVWSAQYGVYHSSTGKTVWYDMPSGTVNLTELVADEHLYGGYYKYVEDSDTHKGDAYTDNGMAMTPGKATVYYLKEVDKNYLKPNIYLVYSENHNGLIRDLFGFVNIDDKNDYTDCGVIVGGDRRSVKDTLVTDSIVVTKGGATYATLTPSNLFGQTAAVFGYTSLSDQIQGGATVQITGYYITKDRIKVTGYKDRMIKFAANDERYGYPVFTGWTTSPGGNTKGGLKNVTPTLEAMAALTSPRMLTARRTLTLAAPADKVEYTITKVYDTGTEEQTVQEGNHTGEINYTPRGGYLFAGWYKDQAFTEPADFSNVQSDLTVYARFVSKKDITLTLTRKSQKSGTTTFNAAAAMKGKAGYDLADVTVTADGAEAVLSAGTVKKTGSGKNAGYTTQYKGAVSVKGLSLIDSFTTSVSWTTPDGTAVTGPAWKCTYFLGMVSVR